MLAACLAGPLVVSLAGCAELPEGKKSLAGESPTIVRRAQMHMGTLVTLTAVAPSARSAQQAVEAGFAEIRRLESLLSTWIPTSELSMVNAAAGGAPVVVGPESLEVLQRSIEIARLTEGGFNIMLGPAIEAWSVTEQARIPEDLELAALRPLVDLSGLHLDRQTRTARLDRRGMRVDVGGIGKGYAADLTVTVMQRAGATAGVVALAGDIKTFGRLPDEVRFRFGIRHPREPGRVLGTLELEHEAISTAGDYERYFERDGVRYHHILDPRTLRPARACQSVTIVAKEGVMADGLDTGIFVMGPERGMALIEDLPDVEGVIVDAEGKVWVSSGLRGRLRFSDPTTSPLPNSPARTPVP